MTLKEYIEGREYRLEFRKEFAKYQPQIECVRILTEARSKDDLMVNAKIGMQNRVFVNNNSPEEVVDRIIMEYNLKKDDCGE